MSRLDPILGILKTALNTKYLSFANLALQKTLYTVMQSYYTKLQYTTCSTASEYSFYYTF